MNDKKKSIAVLAAMYLTVFIGFVLSYLFTYPQYDVLIFTKDFGGSFSEIIRESLFYGNGRFLGNVIGFWFSHHFVDSSFATAFFLTLIVWLTNSLFFDNKRNYIFPIAFIIAFPALGIVREVYLMIAAFSNYAVPLVFFLAAAMMMKKLRTGSNLFMIPLAFFSMSACLFSENTTVVLMCFAVLLIICEYAERKKVGKISVINFVSICIGSLVMYLLPRITKTTEKLSYYRGFVTEPTSLIKNAFSGLRSFAMIANQFVTVYIVISVIMLYLLQRSKKSRQIKLSICLILVVFPLLCILPICSSRFAYRFPLPYLAAECLYMIAVVFVAAVSKRKTILRDTLITVILIGSAVGPILIVNHRGDRTFFTVFAILFCYAMLLVKNVGGEMRINKQLKRATLCLAPVAFATCCAVLLFVTAQNFGTYAFRAEYIAEKRTCTAEISVPYLAHHRLTTEASLGQIDPCLLSDEIKPTFTVINPDVWEKNEEYKKISNTSPVKAIKYGFDMWKYKDPTYPDRLCKRNLSSAKIDK